MSELPERTVEAAAYPVFVGACQAPWTSRTMDEPCPVQPLSKRQAINLARSALTNATDPALGPDRLVVAGPFEQEVIALVCDVIRAQRGHMPPERVAQAVEARFIPSPERTP